MSGHPRNGIVRYSNVPSWAWPGSGWSRFGGWHTAWGITLRYRAHLLHINWRKLARVSPASTSLRGRDA